MKDDVMIITTAKGAKGTIKIMDGTSNIQINGVTKTVSKWVDETDKHFKDENGWIYPKIKQNINFDFSGNYIEVRERLKKILSENKMQHEKITIKIVNNGFHVQVGCQEFVFTSEKELFQAISEYKKDPEKAGKKYCNKGE